MNNTGDLPGRSERGQAGCGQRALLQPSPAATPAPLTPLLCPGSAGRRHRPLALATLASDLLLVARTADPGQDTQQLRSWPLTCGLRLDVGRGHGEGGEVGRAPDSGGY